MELAHSGLMDGQLKPGNVAGRSTRRMAEDRQSARLRLILAALMCLGLILWLNWTNIRAHNRPAVAVICALVCIISLVAIDRRAIPRIDFARKREDDAIRGAEGEEAVGAILDRLPENYMVLHDVPGVWGNIDHVILRKDGAVFVIETKATRGRVSARNGHLFVKGCSNKDFVGQTLRNALHVRDLLAAELGVVPWVDAALVFTRVPVSVRIDKEEIQVMNISALTEWLARSPAKREVGRRATLKWEELRRVLQNETCHSLTHKS